MTTTPEPPVRQEVVKVTLLESDLPKLVSSGPLSRRTTYTLRVDGPFGQVEAANLLRLLQTQVDVLQEGGLDT